MELPFPSVVSGIFAEPLSRDFSEEERTALYRKAASLFEKRGDLEAAGNLYNQAKDFESVAGITKMIGLDLFDKGRTEDLSGFLKVLPDEKIQQDPWLVLLLCMTRRWTGISPEC